MGRFLIYAFSILALYLFLVLLLYIFQRNLIYLPSKKSVTPAEYGVSQLVPVEFETADGIELQAWFKKAEAGKQTILYLHGNGGHIGHRAFKVKPYIESGFGLLLLSYRGYGGNQGKPTEINLYADGRAALRYLHDQQVPLSKTIVYGESLGTGVAVEIVRNLNINCLILEAPFSSLLDVSAHHYFYVPTKLLLKDRFESEIKIREIIAPILFIHGERDKVVPLKFGMELFNAAPEPKELLLIPEAGHNDLYEYSVDQKIKEFIARL